MTQKTPMSVVVRVIPRQLATIFEIYSGLQLSAHGTSVILILNTVETHTSLEKRPKP